MKVLVLGSGAREHALAWKLSRSPHLTELFCAPGNPGTARLAKNVPVKPEDAAAVVALAKQLEIDLVVVGPEAPLVRGVVDALTAAGIAAFGPTLQAARLEGSKAFAKEIMAAAKIPTAQAWTYDSAAEAERQAWKLGRVVVKADGLAAGKGVIVALDAAAAVEAVKALGGLGDAAKRLVLEEVLEGEEVSVIALCDGERYLLLPPAQDHKRVGDGDTGPNTGGMGAYVPAPFLTPYELDDVGRRVIAPCLAEMARRGTPFRGALYAGLMLTKDGPKVLEFNARFGDPETQVLMMQVEDDLLPLLDACARGALKTDRVRSVEGATCGVVLAAEGYPSAPKSGEIIFGADVPPTEDAAIFYAGVDLKDGALATAGGRVLTVCGRGPDIRTARERAYALAEKVSFRGMHFRKDIGAKALR